MIIVFHICDTKNKNASGKGVDTQDHLIPPCPLCLSPIKVKKVHGHVQSPLSDFAIIGRGQILEGEN
jgi:hypothetical protein